MSVRISREPRCRLRSGMTGWQARWGDDGMCKRFFIMESFRRKQMFRRCGVAAAGDYYNVCFSIRKMIKKQQQRRSRVWFRFEEWTLMQSTRSRWCLGKASWTRFTSGTPLLRISKNREESWSKTSRFLRPQHPNPEHNPKQKLLLGDTTNTTTRS